MPQNKNIITIREPFWSAGYKYGFRPPEGIGIKSSLFRGEGSMEIRIGKDKRTYVIDKEEAREFVRQHNSFFYAGLTKLSVLATNILKIKK